MKPPLELVALGGVGEFGRNLLWLRCNGSSLLVDAGVSFPDETFPGVDRIAPDLTALRNERIEAVLLTHGHEDHIGALPLLREWCAAPVYGFPFTLALARRRLEEANRPRDLLIEARGRERISSGEFSFSFFRVSHSVPDSTAIRIEAGGWRLFHSGDFKLDRDPPDGELTDEEGIGAAVAPGVDLALVDSTNAERPGRALSEREAGRGLAAAFAGAPGRVVLTTFSSHVARIRQGLECALAGGRRVALLGRSVVQVAEVAERLGRLSFPAGSRVAPASLSEEPADRVFCVCSGSQGEPSSALYRLALDEHADLKLAAGDLVVFSARTIPGHERSVNRVTDHLVRRGARVVREADPPVHVSGHAHRQDLVDWIRLVRPARVVPIHGERRMLVAAADAAVEAGVGRERVGLLDNGDRMILSEAGDSVQIGAVPSGRIYFDARPEQIEPSVMRDRRQLGQEGVVVIFLPASPGGEITVVTRGVAGDEAALAEEVRRAGRSALARATAEERQDLEWIRTEVTLAAKRACRRTFDIRPLIVPVLI